VPRGAKSRMRRTETPKPIWIKFCMIVDITDIVIHTNFGDHRLRGFGGAGEVKFPPFLLTFIVVLTTLPCERVITTPFPSPFVATIPPYFTLASLHFLSPRPFPLPFSTFPPPPSFPLSLYFSPTAALCPATCIYRPCYQRRRLYIMT